MAQDSDQYDESKSSVVLNSGCLLAATGFGVSPLIENIFNADTWGVGRPYSIDFDVVGISGLVVLFILIVAKAKKSPPRVMEALASAFVGLTVACATLYFYYIHFTPREHR